MFPFYVCVFLFSCAGFSVSRVSLLVLCFLLWWVSLLGVLVPVCAVCLRWVYLLYCFRVLAFVSVVGVVCMCLMYVLLSLVSAFFVFCSLFSSCACSCSFAGGRVWFYWRMCASLMYMFLVSLVFLFCLSFFVLWVFVAQVVCAFWGFVFLGCFLGCLVVVCGGCFLFFGVCRGFCFVGVVVFGVSFLFGRCGSIVCFVFWRVW